MGYEKRAKQKVIRRTFALHKEDIEAIEIIKSHKITVSDFIRFSLRGFAKELEAVENEK